MKIIRTLLLFFFIVCSYSVQAQDILGKWKTIDDETGEAKSVVEIYKKDGLYYGQIVKLFRNKNQDPDPVCDKCPENDERFNQKVIGMEIIKGLSKSGDEYTGGTVLKPDEGKIYKCKIWVEDNKLMIRGYWGIFYRTQEWLKYE
ncbi:DUF2147 domain-containing protein [Fulvivirga lutimaris]|uniref:DUF2147 domain-containing protein n=1 Tax=Fulvivirga lutimaris TaxID=1819566 RepID=UPI0012BBFCB6|nr:DUF2147 domain-containing protein [Fulvivirga lutimaris]MTI39110.1 DUF2147 domain-containing protein [Fulvivirga lutimaris]